MELEPQNEGHSGFRGETVRLKVVALDFDGVIIESNDIKDRAFSEIFLEYPEQYEKMMAYHFAHNAVDRHQKFRYFVNEILKLQNNAALVGELSNRFSEITKQSIIECPYVKGALSFLDYAHNKYPLYLISATPQEELDAIVQARDLKTYFKGIFGAPLRKSDTIGKIMLSENASPSETLFVGDSPEDLKTASRLGIHFVARKSSRDLLSSPLHTVVNDLGSLMGHFKRTYESI